MPTTRSEMVGVVEPAASAPGAALRVCRKCGTPLVADRWVGATSPASASAHGVRLRTVADVPAWAAQFALQGVAVVTRYRCPGCAHVAAVLARDVD
ncbi:hypothetical protein ACFL6C_01280 [Myxococcota bacterium]